MATTSPTPTASLVVVAIANELAVIAAAVWLFLSLVSTGLNPVPHDEVERTATLVAAVIVNLTPLAFFHSRLANRYGFHPLPRFRGAIAGGLGVPYLVFLFLFSKVSFWLWLASFLIGHLLLKNAPREPRFVPVTPIESSKARPR